VGEMEEGGGENTREAVLRLQKDKKGTAGEEESASVW